MIDEVSNQLFEDFLDTVFGTQTRPGKAQFIDKLSGDFAKYLYPPHLRSLVLKRVVAMQSEK